MKHATIRIPTPLRGLTGGADRVEVDAETAGQALELLAERHDGLRARIFDPDGRLRPFVNVFLGSERLVGPDGLATPLGEGAVLTILPAVAGGARGEP